MSRVMEYWVKVRWATGLMNVDATGIIREPVAPIFGRWVGSKFLNFVMQHSAEVQNLEDAGDR